MTTDGAEEKEHHAHRHKSPKSPGGRRKRGSKANVLNPSSANEAPKKVRKGGGDGLELPQFSLHNL